MSIARFFRIVTVSVFAVLIVGCAHPITMNTETAPERNDSTLIQKKVAYAISSAERGRKVITPGGGGDRVSYFPYRDLEKPIRDALRAVYVDVVAIKTAADAIAIKESGVSLIFTPVIKTTSSSPSLFAWPPTVFATEIVCTVTDASGAEITRVSATGNGTAEYSDFKENLGFSAKRAAIDVSEKLSQEIRRTPKLN